MMAERIYQSLCRCPDTPCPWHPTPNRPFQKGGEELELDKFSEVELLQFLVDILAEVKRG